MYVINRVALFTYQGINFFERDGDLGELYLESLKMPFFVVGKHVFIIDLHFGMKSITPTSNQFCTNMENKTLILKVEILLLESLVRHM